MEETIQLELDKLKAQIAELTKQNEAFAAQELSRLQKEYKHLEETIMLAVDDGDNTETKWQHFMDIVDGTDLLKELIEVNNPITNIFGENSFQHLLLSSTEKHFTTLLEVDDEKKLFRKVIGNIINNPIVETILVSNPVTHIVSRVIDRVSSFFKNTATGRTAKKVVIGTKEVFGMEKIEAFYKDLEHYILFYEKLNNASKVFEEQKNEFMKQVPKTNKLMTNYHQKFFDKMGLAYEPNGRNSKKVRDLLKINAEEANDYTRILEDEKIKAGYKAALQYPLLRNRILFIKGEFYKIIIQFLEKYEAALKILRESNDATMKITEVTNLEKQITGFKAKLTKIIKRAEAI